MMVSGVETIPQALLDLAARMPAGPAMRRKRRGVWEAISCRAYCDAAVDLALALRADGVRDGTVLIAAFNSPEWLMADAGIMMAGARSAAVYPDMASRERIAILRALSPAVVFCGGQEQVDQILESEADGALPHLSRIVHFDATGLGATDDARLTSLEDYRLQGRSKAGQRQALLDAVAAADPEAVAVVALTRGVSGAVRPVNLSHAALLAAGRRLRAGLRPGGCERMLAFLPLANAVARQHSATLQLLTGGQICFPDEAQDLVEVLREVQPDSLALFPNGWAEIAATLVSRLERSRRLPSRLRQAALARPGAWLHQAVFAPGMRRFIGLGRIRDAFCFGGVPDHATRTALDKLGIPITYGYGLTELGGATHLSASPADLLRHPLRDIAVTRDDAGEICVAAGPGQIVRTGDRTAHPSASHAVAGRVGDVLRAGGRGMALNELEERLFESRWIRRAAACARDGNVHLLIELDVATTGRWASDRKLSFTDYASLTSLDEVRRLIADEVGARLGGIDGVELVRGHILLDRPFDLEEGELAPVFGLRRHRASERLQHPGERA